MKRMKKFASMFLAIIMMVALAIPAFADTTDARDTHKTAEHTITINNTKDGHKYTAYQVFSGAVTTLKQGNTETRVLVDIEWGNGVNAEKLLAALKAESKFEVDGTNVFAAADSAEDVARILETELTNKDALMDRFAELVESATTTAAGSSSEETSPYTIDVVGDGYYIVKDDAAIASGDAATRFILRVAEDNVTVTAKADAPSIDKIIAEGGPADEDGNISTEDGSISDDSKYNNVAIGDTVKFEITSHVPEMDGYEKYYFVVKDTMSKGLTYNEDSLIVKVGNETLTKGEDYTVEVTDIAEGTKIVVIFHDFLQYKGQAEADVKVIYTADVNTDAVIGVVGNPNKVELEYSNNPNTYDSGDPENEWKPESDSPTGKTPESKTITYVTGLKLKKVANKEDGESLTGAAFELTGTKINQAIVKKGVYVASDNGTYYKLKDGTYTTAVPVTDGTIADTSKYYESTTQKYVLKDVTVVETSSNAVQATAEVDSNGILSFQGLSSGSYVITEIKAPDGYNKLKKPIEIEITWAAPEAGKETCTWTATRDGAEISVEETTNLFTFNVVNKSGILLPTTGGVGTTMLYIAGIVMLIAAGALLVVKKRMGSEK